MRAALLAHAHGGSHDGYTRLYGTKMRRTHFAAGGDHSWSFLVACGSGEARHEHDKQHDTVEKRTARSGLGGGWTSYGALK
jgi:hypothetical protein